MLILSVLFGVCAAPAAAAAGDQPLFDRVTQQARALAGKPYSNPKAAKLPDALSNMDFQAYQQIRFDKSHALWRGEALFDIEFFHLGFLYKNPVIINEVVNGQVRTVQYDPSMFDFGDRKALKQQLSPDLGFAGFRVHYPLNTPKYKDELLVFLGASYFRMVGRGQNYGLSARGLAVNTALPQGEEFPRFREFWLVKPGPQDTSLTIFALLNSPSVTGAYRFELHPGQHVSVDVKARLFARDDVEKLGVAPLTSMFMWGENRVRQYDDYRPEVHDSDGLLLHTGAGEWIWRPLTNPRKLRVTSLMDQDPNGFGLMQRDRNFDHYQDVGARFENRPSLWVEPEGEGWGKGAVQVIEIPSDDESNDNIVAFWVPDQPFKAGQERDFQYRLQTFGAGKTPDTLAHVKRTRIGWGAIPGTKNKPPHSLRQFVVDFQGGPLTDLAGEQSVQADLSAHNGDAKNVTVERLPADEGWRVAFKLSPKAESKAVDLRMNLTLRDKRLSETWNYVWDPDAIR